jgi:hypothetical protein
MPAQPSITRWSSGAMATRCRNCRPEEGVQQFPQSRDAGANWASPITSRKCRRRRMEQFEALQAIDPDDLAAHYNLVAASTGAWA